MSDIVEMLLDAAGGNEAHVCVIAAAEIERLRGAYEQERKDCINLTEKVIPGLRDEIERLRLQVKMIPLPEYRDDPRLHEVIEEQKAEIERLREAVKFLNSFRPDARELANSVMPR